MKILGTVTYALEVPSVANIREHWAKKAARTRRHRTTAWAEMRSIEVPPLTGSVVVTLTRIAPRPLDSDNLASAFKATRDGVADFFKVDDADPRIEWKYAQRKGEPKQHLVCIEVSA